VIRALCVALLGAVCMTAASAEAADGKPAWLLYKPVKTVADLRGELSKASAAHYPVMVVIRAEWALSALKFEREVLADPEVQAALKGWAQLRIDVTDNDDEDKKVIAHFDIFGPPFVVLYGADGKERRDLRFGFMKAAEFAAVIRQAIAPANPTAQ